jgi:uncharacterized protein (TIGR02217 family)
MGWCFAEPLRPEREEHRAVTWMPRFDPRFWTIDFPRPMMGCVVTTGADALRVELAFTGKDNLAGLIWASEDKWDHPLLSYETARDFRAVQLSFRWRSAGVKPLDAVWGPVLTIEGRDAGGAARAWYVRLWNYAVGTPEDAEIALDFGALDGGFLLPEEADPVWAGDVDRMFISLVPPDYDGSAGDYAAMQGGWVELSEIAAAGAGAVLRLGDAMLPNHGWSAATAYDDAYNLTPARLLRMVEALGYSGSDAPLLLHYVGMSHYMALARVGGDWRVTGDGALAGPAAAWHADYAARAKAMDLTIIWSLSYELFAAYCPPDWMQRDVDGNPALTGWVPPSSLLSPANAAAMAWLRSVAGRFVAIAQGAAMPVHFQVGEPWWWITPSRKICAYDAAATAMLGPLSVPIADMGAALNGAQRAMLDALGAMLSASTAELSAHVKGLAPAAVTYLLAYLPTILDAGMPEARRANLPTGWAKPAFDVLQLEDYDWAARGQAGASAAGAAAATARLGYPHAEQHYLTGFVLDPADKAQWANIDAAGEAAARRGVARVFVWALPQIARDGFVHFQARQEEEDGVEPFADVDFPIAIGRAASVTTEFATAIITSQSGAEQRSPDWADARMRYDVGPGLRSEADVMTLAAFFRARRGPAQAFRFRDPFDDAGEDEWLGSGDAVRTDFALVKTYGAGADVLRRRITRPVAASVAVTVDGSPAFGWTLADGGVVRFATPPATGAAVRASYVFDVPVRFAEDRLEVARGTFLAGELMSVPLIEVREAALVGPGA